MQTITKQQGAGLLSWLLVIIVIAAAIALAVKLAPIYIENYMMKRILESVREESVSSKDGASNNANQNMRDFILHRFEVNNIHHVSSNNLTLTNTPTSTNVRVLYEVRVPIVANIDAILHFDNTVQVPTQ
ncbi:hypothetical protein BH10PSE19_BH10PSE19_07250 [soil metagenome]